MQTINNKVYIHYNQGSIRGPGAVKNNLLKGLQELDVKIVSKPNEADYIGCLQHPGLFYNHLPEQTLMGPNLFVLPHESPELCNKFKNFIVPSEWVKNKYYTYDSMKEKNINVWSVGIDTDYWSPRSPFIMADYEKKLDCFIYFKNRTQQDLALVYKLCTYFKLNFEIIQYGSYSEEQLKDLCNRTKFAILLTGTESQGIAYMNILSMNIPCYVFNTPVWTYENNKDVKFPATSVPYFDNNCGVITKDLNLDEFKDFVRQVNESKFNPRNYILENHTLSFSAQKYLDLLRKING